MMLNLLSSRVIRTRIGGRLHRLTLPEVLDALMRDEVGSFPGLRPHQRHAWHMFLAQLAAIALWRAGERRIPGDAQAWARLLPGLTNGAEEPWSLVVADLTKPAFLQPPVPEGQLSVLKNTIPTPDALDVLITAKNFDLKSAVAVAAGPDEWMFALISLQTMEGFLGAGNYGIARMNGGFSARPFIGLAPAGGPGAHLRRDVLAMLAGRERLLENFSFYDPNGIALLWLEPWDGASSLSLARLDPWFIEICRRIRFASQDEGFTVLGVGSVAPRIDAKAQNGVTGDFWAPVNDAEGKAFSLDARGFSYRVLCRLLFGEGATRIFRLPPAMAAQPGEGDMRMVARGVTRGQGKTEGFHERTVPMRAGFVRALGGPKRPTLGQIADRQQKEIKQIADALRFGCAVIAIGGAPKKPGKDDYAHALPYTRRLEAEADAGFFEALQAREAEGDAAKIPYLKQLIRYAERLLTEAAEAIPCVSQHRWRARVRAPGAFRAVLWGDRSALAGDRDLIFPKQEKTDA